MIRIFTAAALLSACATAFGQVQVKDAWVRGVVAVYFQKRLAPAGEVFLVREIAERTIGLSHVLVQELRSLVVDPHGRRR